MDFQHRKLTLALWIMGIGMLAAVIWDGWQGWGLGNGYPYNTFLFNPKIRFSDFSDALFMSRLPNPYDDPNAFYLPFAWVALRLISPLPCAISLVGFLFFSLAGLTLLLVTALEKVILNPRRRIFLAFLFLGLSYPVAICVDRGNIELFVALGVAASLHFLHQARYLPAALCLLPVICLKLYPALLLALLWRQRKMRLSVVLLATALGITLLSFFYLSLFWPVTWQSYSQDLTFFNRIYIYENHSLEGGASLWNAYKIGLIAAGDWGIIHPVDFSFDGSFIQFSYTVYTLFMLGLVLFLVVHVCLVEKEFLRCAMLLLLFMAIATPCGADYRLLYVCMALVMLVLLKTLRKYDCLILILLAFTLVPKKEYFLTFAGLSETGFADVAIQVILNPLCVFAAICLLLHDGWKQVDAPWCRMRLIHLIHATLLKKGAGGSLGNFQRAAARPDSAH